MNIPKNVKVGPWNYKIEEFEAAEAATAQRYGEHDGNKKIIRVDFTHWGHGQASCTLFHEIMHACCHVACLDVEELKDEEDLVRPLTNMMIQVLWDNPKVAKFILDGSQGP